jgi:hypothetical protein
MLADTVSITEESPMAGKIEDRIRELGLELPSPLQIPPGLDVPLVMVKIVGTRLIVSGHGPQEDRSVPT